MSDSGKGTERTLRMSTVTDTETSMDPREIDSVVTPSQLRRLNLAGINSRYQRLSMFLEK